MSLTEEGVDGYSFYQEGWRGSFVDAWIPFFNLL